MDKIDIYLLRRIELILGLHFKEWQVNYILDIPMVLDMKITGRHTGKTLAHVIKTLFLEDTPIRVYALKEIENVSDSYCVSSQQLPNLSDHYVMWYRDYLIDIYTLLVKNGISPRKLIFDLGNLLKTESEKRVNSRGFMYGRKKF
jgi:hypothetical protein